MLLEETTTHPYELRAQSAKVLLGRLYRDVSGLVAEEVELAKLEIHERASRALGGLRTLSISLACATVAMASLAGCAVAVLTLVMPLWLAALIVGVVFSVAALALAAASRKTFAVAAEPFSSMIGEAIGPARGAATEEELRLRIETTRRHLDQTLRALEHKSDLVGPLRDTALGLGSLGIAVSSIVRGATEPPKR
ncbi:MAG TPA: phage holin family protein [Candidatus Cybelea sp.]|jgi:type IV secretory pathway TrbD component|nr:phage holin family protein [Candidatus Cybelea sp.]